MCGKKGFLSRRWVKSSYYPMYASKRCAFLNMLEYRLSVDPSNATVRYQIGRIREDIRGDHYRGDSKYFLPGHDKKEDKEYFDKSTAYRLSSFKFYYDYVGHYSPEKYEKEMNDFRQGKRKSRPNGRIWHKIPVEKDQRRGLWYSNQSNN